MKKDGKGLCEKSARAVASVLFRRPSISMGRMSEAESQSEEPLMPRSLRVAEKRANDQESGCSQVDDAQSEASSSSRGNSMPKEVQRELDRP